MVTAPAKINVSDRLQRKPLWNAIAISYVLAGYVGGIGLLLLTNGWLNATGVVLLTHSLVMSAYLAHEFMHGTIFKSFRGNEIGGSVMLWLNGGCYARFRDLALDHIGHHVNRVDYSGFDLLDFLDRIPTTVRRLILTLEWLYVPVISYIIGWRAIAAPFFLPRRRDERSRVALILGVRMGLFTVLGLVSLKALLLYWLSYTGMVLVLRLLDAFQHTYEVFPMGSSLPKRSRAYEHANTFTTLISERYWWLNLLLLNFGYHNAHHELMKCPWHNLHQLNREFSTQQSVHSLTLPQMLANYHRFRLDRIFFGQGQATDERGKLDLDAFYGAVGVSMLVKY